MLLYEMKYGFTHGYLDAIRVGIYIYTCSVSVSAARSSFCGKTALEKM